MLKNNQNKNLVLIEDLGMMFATENSKTKDRFGLYKCYCGNEFKARIYAVKSGHTKSCGCRNRHHHYKHRLYSVWYDMKNRCHNENNINYKHYGARGIAVCDRWLDIKNFIEDMYSAFKEGLTLDRSDNQLGYSKENCRWTTKVIQSRNTRVLRISNTSGYRGVNFQKSSNRFRARITVNYKEIHLGLFETAIEAARVYDSYVIDNNLEHTKNFN